VKPDAVEVFFRTARRAILYCHVSPLALATKAPGAESGWYADPYGGPTSLLGRANLDRAVQEPARRRAADRRALVARMMVISIDTQRSQFTIPDPIERMVKL
jgi:hypothetical protein